MHNKQQSTKSKRLNGSGGMEVISMLLLPTITGRKEHGILQKGFFKKNLFQLGEIGYSAPEASLPLYSPRNMMNNTCKYGSKTHIPPPLPDLNSRRPGDKTSTCTHQIVKSQILPMQGGDASDEQICWARRHGPEIMESIEEESIEEL
eukprot:scaffold61668_cov69-Attheya_sp.AAC.1